MKKFSWLDCLGWMGALAIITAYAILSLGLVATRSGWYQALNLFGATFVCAIAIKRRAYQPAVINFVWALIALMTLIRITLIH